ncbi:Nuclear pore complex protein Nup98-Nup96 [Trichoplax sp. H2]|nr:Nuclear pore complex protein Nup98-Nup96 [Trichoplax sp. H2]|eukprot:RDD45950.1 Nuclear pore complex protein Nup98-Nup96 [Trichoplax sp. H2]
MFGSTNASTPFGGNQSGFTATSGGLFGQSSTNTFGSGSTGFGTSTTSGFGNTGGGFGTQSKSLFGNTATTSASGGLFGTSGNQVNPSTSFGGSGFGGFGNMTNTSNSGSNFFSNTNTNTSKSSNLFGNNTNNTFGGFGNMSQAQTGSTIKYNPPSATDTVTRNGRTENVSARIQCISAMNEYIKKSPEELRYEDYMQNRKGPSSGSFTGGGIKNFGNTSTSTSGFGGSSGFGQGTTSVFGQTPTSSVNTGSLFGQSQQTGFGQNAKNNFFNNTSTSTSNAFGGVSQSQGFGQNSSLSFGQSNQQKPLFGNLSSSNPASFGTNTSTFGQSQSFGQSFGQPNTSTNLFGNNNKPTFGQTSTAPTSFSSGFGFPSNNTTNTTSSAPSTGLFGTNTFGTSSTNTGFNASNSLFGNKGGFGTGFGNTSNSAFSSTANKGSLPNSSQSFNLKPGSNTSFGTGGTNFNLGFGSAQPQLQLIAGNSMIGLNNPHSAGINNNAMMLQGQIKAMINSPYGDTPLFRNAVRDSRHDYTNSIVSTESVLNNSSYAYSKYRVSSRLGGKIRLSRPKKFDQLSDDLNDELPSEVTLKAKKNWKKLTLVDTPDKKDNKNNSETKSTTAVNYLEWEKGYSYARFGSDSHDNRSETSIPSQPPESSPKILVNNCNTGDDVNDVFPSEADNTSASLVLPQSKLDENSIITKPMPVRPKDPQVFASTPAVEQFLNKGPDQDLSNFTPEGNDATPKTNGSRHISEATLVQLSKEGYYTIPHIDEINEIARTKERVILPTFTVGREGFGSVYYDTPTDVTGLDLDDIVEFRFQEVSIYPDESLKPPNGTRLNKPAIVTLLAVWPGDKKNRDPIIDPKRLQLMGYAKRLRRITSRMGATFIDYKPDNGAWQFRVEHFSKYGLKTDEDEDSSPSQNSNTQKTQHLKTQKLLEAEHRKLWSTADTDEDSPMEINDDEAMSDSEELNSNNDLDSIDSQSTRNQDEDAVYSNLTLDTRRIQVMKASFFRENVEENKDDYKGQPVSGKRIKSSATDNVDLLRIKRFHKAVSSKSTTMPISGSNELVLTPRKSMIRVGNNATNLLGVSSVEKSATLDEGNNRTNIASTVLSRSRIEAAQEFDQDNAEKRLLLLPVNQPKLISHNESVAHGKGHCVIDAALFHGRSFRVGWGPNWMFASINYCSQSGKDSSEVRESQRMSVGAKVPNFSENSSFSVNIKKFEDEKPKVAVDRLDIEFNHSICNLEHGCLPLFSPSRGKDAAHEYARQSATVVAQGAEDKQLQHASQVWDLVVALWGFPSKATPDGNESSSDESDTEMEAKNLNSYEEQNERRHALSNWFRRSVINSNSTKATANSPNISMIFDHLTTKSINEACNICHEIGDYRLALLISQLSGSRNVTALVSRQLDDWYKNKADQFIDHNRLKIYALLAGKKLWETSNKIRICPCEDLNWKKAMALHMWYILPTTKSIRDVISNYKAAYQGGNGYEKYANPPLPFYMQEKLKTDDNHKSIEDLCYHLLCLYCDRSHKLQQMLASNTFTPFQLDCSLSWHLYQCLVSLEYHHLSAKFVANLHTNYAAQLESCGNWHWAVFVMLFLKDDQRRERAVRDLLNRHCKLTTVDVAKEKFIEDKLLIPPAWIHEAKALRAKYNGLLKEEAFHLLKAKQWQAAHNVIINDLAADCILEGDTKYLRKILEEIQAEGADGYIENWINGGQLYLDYILLKETVNTLNLQKNVQQLLRDCSEIQLKLNSLKPENNKRKACKFFMSSHVLNIINKYSIRQLRINELKAEVTAPPLVKEGNFCCDSDIAYFRNIMKSVVSN